MALGPPVGAVVFVWLIPIFGEGTLTFTGLIELIFGSIFVAALGYMYGLVPAIAAGTLIGVYHSFFRPASLLIAVAVGLVIGFGYIGFRIYMAQKHGRELDGLNVYTTFVLTNFLSTLVCWAVVRNWRVRNIDVPECAQ